MSEQYRVIAFFFSFTNRLYFPTLADGGMYIGGIVFPEKTPRPVECEQFARGAEREKFVRDIGEVAQQLLVLFVNHEAHRHHQLTNVIRLWWPEESLGMFRREVEGNNVSQILHNIERLVTPNRVKAMKYMSNAALANRVLYESMFNDDDSWMDVFDEFISTETSEISSENSP